MSSSKLELLRSFTQVKHKSCKPIYNNTNDQGTYFRYLLSTLHLLQHLSKIKIQKKICKTTNEEDYQRTKYIIFSLT